jgi:hypothetical protein
VRQGDFERRLRVLGWSIMKAANTPYHRHGRKGSQDFNRADAKFLEGVK